jgi:glycosyltransferase involved in cell wall biosynthesis
MLAWLIAKGLDELGHEVVLIAPKGSKAPGNVTIHETTEREPERQAYGGYWQKLPQYDCIIDHSWEKWSYILKIEGRLKAPIMGVLHAPVKTMYQTPPPVDKPCMVAISKDQATSVEEHLKCQSRVAYNGCDVDYYKPTGIARRNRYLFLARMSTIKGPDIAVAVAKKCRVGLDVVGDDQLTGEPTLVSHVKHECTISPNILYVGPQTRQACVSWFNGNKALLHPNKTFREPFGLAPVEAQLCGMPVIAWDNGAMRETVKHGETGFLVNSQQEMEELVAKNAVADISSDRCREWASQFSYMNMISRYEELCKEAIEAGW